MAEFNIPHNCSIDRDRVWELSFIKDGKVFSAKAFAGKENGKNKFLLFISNGRTKGHELYLFKGAFVTMQAVYKYAADCGSWAVGGILQKDTMSGVLNKNPNNVMPDCYGTVTEKEIQNGSELCAACFYYAHCKDKSLKDIEQSKTNLPDEVTTTEIAKHEVPIAVSESLFLQRLKEEIKSFYEKIG